MEKNSDKENKKLFYLNELMDDMVIENNNNSEIYEEYGDKREAIKMIKGFNGVSGGRYTDKFIHYIMRNDDLEKFKHYAKEKKKKKKSKNKDKDNDSNGI